MVDGDQATHCLTGRSEAVVKGQRMRRVAALLGLRPALPTLKEKEVVLTIADISGYTEYLLSTQTALLHAQTIINELIESIIEQVQIPLKVAKLGGDAVFLYASHEGNDIQ